MSTEKPYTLHLGDCREVLKTLPANSIDAVVTDPPYGLSFMGKGWDHGVPGVDFWTEVYRVMKPGAHLIAYGGTRTIHRLTVGIEDAGFEIRDSIYWLYGSGFPKSHNVSKAIDAHLGADRTEGEREWRGGQRSSGILGTNHGTQCIYKFDTPATPEAEQWDGWGTALKPAVEPAVLARKPLAGTVAQNVLQYGTGGINIDGCRIGTSKDIPASGAKYQNGFSLKRKNPDGLGTGFDPNIGRWPANILLDEVSAEMMDEQSGDSNSGIRRSDDSHSVSGSTFHIQRDGITPRGHNDSGGASRFFYIAKASSTEREIGLQGMDKIPTAAMAGNLIDGQRLSGSGEPIHTPIRANHHPTVKPLQLMQYMIRLITPPGGTVLDPFMGSGSTGAACMLEGVQFVGIDITPEYIDIAEKRISYWRQRAFTPLIDAPLNVPKSIIKPVNTAQQTLNLED
jgi:site-specific DNA-methyltransferase (adenine-specific)